MCRMYRYLLGLWNNKSVWYAGKYQRYNWDLTDLTCAIEATLLDKRGRAAALWDALSRSGGMNDGGGGGDDGG